MRALVVGGSGLIGSALVMVLQSAGHSVIAPTHTELDLLDLPPHVPLPQVDAAFICAGIKGLQPCEGNGMSWRVNVDGALLLGKALMKRGVNLLYVSSDAVEWSNSSYARQKALVEVGLLAAGDPVIVRPCRVSDWSASILAEMMVKVIGSPGIYHWAEP